MKYLISILDSIFMKIYEFKPLNNLLSNSWYSVVGKLDRTNSITTMNYGFEDGNPITFENIDEVDRYSLQLYHHVASLTPIRDKEVLEIGCGRGGGASYIARYLSPKHITGLDLTRESIRFGSKHYSKIVNLSFIQGDAHKLPIQDEAIDVVINVETCHHYADIPKFLSEVRRVLRPGGYLIITDYREMNKWKSFEDNLANSGMSVISRIDITSHVLRALDKDSDRRIELIHKLSPKIFWKLATDFSGVKGSDLYNSFKNGEWSYVTFVTKKS